MSTISWYDPGTHVAESLNALLLYLLSTGDTFQTDTFSCWVDIFDRS